MHRELISKVNQDSNSIFDIYTRFNLAVSLKALNISNYTEHHKGGRKFYKAANDLDDLAITKLNRIIKKFYKVKQSDRHLICNQVSSLMKDAELLNIIKMDIKKFYASVDTSLLLQKINSDRLFSPYTFLLLKQSIDSSMNSHTSGLPEGLNLSATLAELYLREFDKNIRRIPGVVYYCRFVDDIMIFTSKQPDSILDKAKNLLAGYGEINSEKTAVVHKPNQTVTDFNYLGYNFRKNRSNDPCKISIADKKIKKLKTKIVLTLLAYERDQSFVSLFNRVRFLSSNAEMIFIDRETPILSGLFYTYSLATESSIKKQLKHMDQFLQKLVFSSRGRCHLALANLTKEQKSAIISSSFVAGYTNRKRHNYTASEIKHLITPWNNVTH